MTDLVLAFDAACTRCRVVAATVARTVGPELEVLPLTDYRVVAWCTDAGVPGDGPTLLEITPTAGDDRVDAWTGVGIVRALRRRLGLRRTARLAAALARHGVLRDATRGVVARRVGSRRPSPGRGA